MTENSQETLLGFVWWFSDELEALNFENFLASCRRRGGAQPWSRLATFEFFFSTAVHTVP